MKKKKIVVNPLSTTSIREAQKQIEQYKIDLANKVNLFTQRLAEIGVGIAQARAIDLDAYYSGNLVASINLKQGDVIQHGSKWVVYTDCPYAKYVEFGTGIVGKDFPHDIASQLGWKYDINNHGKAGWYYHDATGFHWTNGMSARPFMYEASLELGLRVSKVAKEVFGH